MSGVSHVVPTIAPGVLLGAESARARFPSRGVKGGLHPVVGRFVERVLPGLRLGLAIVIVTIANGGGPLSTGVLLGIIFTLLGAGRFYLSLRKQS